MEGTSYSNIKGLWSFIKIIYNAPTAMKSEKGTEVFPPGIWRMAAPRSARFESLDAIEERNQKNRTYVRNNQAR